MTLRRTSPVRTALLFLFAAVFASLALADTPLSTKISVYKHSSRSKDYEAAARALRSIGEDNSAGAMRYLLSIQLDDLNSRDEFEAFRDALGLITDADGVAQSVAVYDRLSKQRDGWTWRVILLDAVERRNGHGGFEIVERAVADDHPKVRLAAARALERIDGSADRVVAAAIEAMKQAEKARDRGTPHIAAREALTKLTGVDHATADAWNAYWSANHTTFDPDRKGDTAEPQIQPVGEYYQSSVTSHRLVFVIDVSRSMWFVDTEGYDNVPPIPDTPGAQTPRGADQGRTVHDPAWNAWLRQHPEAERIVRAKIELKKMIASLPEGAAFNIIAFESKLIPWKGGLEFATDANKKVAVAWIDRLAPNGATRADLALATVFKTCTDADTLYFLSDGIPSPDGKQYMPIEPILDAVEKMNRYNRLVIHTIGMGPEGEPFLRPLAERHGGVYQQVTGVKPLHQPAPVPDGKPRLDRPKNDR